MKIWRIVIAVVGVGVGTYGIFQLLTQLPWQTLVLLALWLIGALIIHDGLLSPAVIGVGAALRRYVPDRGRRYLQFGLIMAAMVTVIAVPMIYRANTQPPAKAFIVTPRLAPAAPASPTSSPIDRTARDHGGAGWH